VVFVGRAACRGARAKGHGASTRGTGAKGHAPPTTQGPLALGPHRSGLPPAAPPSAWASTRTSRSGSSSQRSS
jgi:hypothetical protein